MLLTAALMSDSIVYLTGSSATYMFSVLTLLHIYIAYDMARNDLKKLFSSSFCGINNLEYHKLASLCYRSLLTVGRIQLESLMISR